MATLLLKLQLDSHPPLSLCIVLRDTSLLIMLPAIQFAMGLLQLILWFVEGKGLVAIQILVSANQDMVVQFVLLFVMEFQDHHPLHVLGMELVWLRIAVNAIRVMEDFNVSFQCAMASSPMSRVFAQVMVSAMGLIIVLAPRDMVVAIVNTLLSMESFKQILRFAMEMELVFLRIIAHAIVDGREVNVSNSHALECCQQTLQFVISREVSVFGKTVANAIFVDRTTVSNRSGGFSRSYGDFVSDVFVDALWDVFHLFGFLIDSMNSNFIYLFVFFFFALHFLKPDVI